MINKELLQKRFSENARTYDQYAVVQKKMGKQLVKIAQDSHFQNKDITILEIGCGTGSLTEQLCEVFPHARIKAIDLAPGMIALAKQKVNNQHVQFECGDIEDMPLFEKFDLIISNATFQWFNSLAETLKKLYQNLNANGKLVFSTFGQHTFHELHTAFQKAKESISYSQHVSPGQSFYSLNEISTICDDVLSSKQVEGIESFEVETFPNVRGFFESIKKIGANNSNQQSYCQSPKLFREMIRIYERDFQENNQIKATYHCLFLKIVK